MKSILIAAGFCLSVLTVSGQTLQEMFSQSKKAYLEKDFGTFLKITSGLNLKRPSHPVITYNLAAAYALNHNPDSAVSVLKRLILMNSQTSFENDSDFVSLRALPGYAGMLQLKAEQGKEIAQSNKVTGLTEKMLHPEGLVYLPKHNTWLASGIRQRKIVRFDPDDGTCRDWLSGQDMLAVFALKADAEENYLWAATAAIPEMENYDGKPRAEILKIDIRSRTVVSRQSIPGNHVFGDLVVSKTGDVYVSDSGEPHIYKIEKGQLKIWADLSNEAFNLQGMAFDEKEEKLIIADYLKGILIIPLRKTSGQYWLSFPENTTTKGIDGILFHDHSIVAVHNGVHPIRIIRYFTDPDLKNITHFTIADQARPEFDEPTLPFLYNKMVYFFANAPWKAYDAKGNPDLSRFKAPELYRFPLK